jgi:hypothetical protein
MTKYSEDEILGGTPEFGLELFMAGLAINDIFLLKKFCREIGYAAR